LNLNEFIDFALTSNTTTEIFELKIKEEACKSIKKHTKLDICTYKFIIQEEYIRHVKNKHEEDLYYLSKIPEILNSFSSIEKSLTRNTQTGQTDVSLVFRKKFDDGVVRMVALRVIKFKILSFKTLFRQ
jgi:chloramphenicol O-acetyltransferase